MILSCPACPSRYRLDASRLAPAGSPVRCKNCRTVFRAFPPAEERDTDGNADRTDAARGMRPTVATAPKAKPRAAAAAEAPPARPAPKIEKPAAKPRTDRETGPVPVPVSVAGSEDSPLESDIRRLTRIIFSDIVIYGPEKADKAIRQGRFPESFKMELEEGRKIIRARFPADTASALAIFERCLEELLEARKKELASAIAL